MPLAADARSAGRFPEAGSAAVEFALVGAVLIFVLLGVLQVGVYFHVRNVVAASAAEGARYGANADVDSAAAASRAADIAGRAVGREAIGLRFTAGEVAGAGGSTLVEVHARGRLPLLFAPVGALPLDLRARALKEGS